jgi:DNA-binding PadR family transcriptional regulator
MALGTLASHGPQHGHQIRRTAEVTNVGEWGGVSVGALYRELRLMAGEGLVTEVRTEQVGRRPARTVYAITDEGRLELGTLREQAIRDTRPAPDPVGVALTFSGTGDDPGQFVRWMNARRDLIAVALREVSADREQLVAKGYISPLVAVVMRRTELMLDGELRWHEELMQALAVDWPGGTVAADAAALLAGAAITPARPDAGQAPDPGQDADAGQNTDAELGAVTGQKPGAVQNGGTGQDALPGQDAVTGQKPDAVQNGGTGQDALPGQDAVTGQKPGGGPGA